MDRAARDDRALAPRPPGLRQTRGIDRSGPSRTADPAELYRQEYSDRARRSRTGANRRRGPQGRRPRRTLLDGRADQPGRELAMTALLLKGGPLIDPALAIDRLAHLL